MVMSIDHRKKSALGCFITQKWCKFGCSIELIIFVI